MLYLKSLGKTAAIGGLTLLLLPVSSTTPGFILKAEAQGLPSRVRRPPVIPPGAILVPRPSLPTAPPANQEPVPQAPANAQPPTPPASQPTSSTSLPPSLFEKPAQPAQIEFSSETLSIHADNSSLGEILHALSAKSGMHIEGLNGDERVFGTFGPGKPRAVLSDLLNGTPYNILMVGDLSNGAPRQLILSPASPASASPSPEPQPTQTAEANPEQDQDDADAPQPPSVPRSGFYPPGAPPGIPGPQPAAPNQEVKTPQQLFRELQEIRQQKLQSQQQQQQ